MSDESIVKTPGKRGRKPLADIILKDANKSYEDVKDVQYQGNDTVELFLTPAKMKALLESKMYRSPKTNKRDENGNIIYNKNNQCNFDKPLPGYDKLVYAIAVHPSIDIELIKVCIAFNDKSRELVMQNIVNGPASLSLMIPEFYNEIITMSGIHKAFVRFGTLNYITIGLETLGLTSYCYPDDNIFDTLSKNPILDDSEQNTISTQLYLYDLIVSIYKKSKNSYIEALKVQKEEKSKYCNSTVHPIYTGLNNIVRSLLSSHFEKLQTLHEKLAYFVAEEMMSYADIAFMFEPTKEI